jgi:hypothetical protein
MLKMIGITTIKVKRGIQIDRSKIQAKRESNEICIK